MVHLRIINAELKEHFCKQGKLQGNPEQELEFKKNRLETIDKLIAANYKTKEVIAKFNK